MKGRKLLNNTLRINAAFSLLSGLNFIFFDKNIAGILLEKDLGSLIPIGISLVVFSIFVFAVSILKKVNKYLVGTIIVMDLLWVIGSIFLIIAGADLFTGIGLILIAFVAAVVALFAIFQTLGLIKYLKNQPVLENLS